MTREQLGHRTKIKNAGPRWKLKGFDLQLRLRADGIVVEDAPPSRFFHTGSHHTLEEAESLARFIPRSKVHAFVKQVVTQLPVQDAINQTLTDMEPANMLQMAEGAGEGAIGLPALPVILAASAAAMTPFRGVKTHQQSVRILWTQDGTPRSSNFALSAKDSDSFARSVAAAVGLPFTEAHFGSDAHDQPTWQMTAEFPGELWVGAITFGAGKYRLLTTKCLDGTNLVYLLTGDQEMPQEAASVLLAESFPLGSEKPWRIKMRGNTDGSLCLVEVDTDSERLVVDACERN